MNRFFGFDLGDAECAISFLTDREDGVPVMIPVGDAKSFISAYALLQDGTLLIGEKACYVQNAVKRKLRFKSRFLTDPASASDIRHFSSGVLCELYQSGALTRGEDCCFYIGCPAGWDKHVREEYREIFEKALYPPVRIISESRAALISACQSRHLQIGQDILSKPVLVVDIGSSTTDFAYVYGGKEVEMRTAGEVSLGGGVMDEILLEEAVRASGHADEIRRVFDESEPWKNYCEFAARKLKERYFSEPEYWKDNPCRETILIQYDRPLRLTIRMNEEIAGKLLGRPSERLGRHSFRDVFIKSLQDVRDNLSGDMPELLFLTGGVSKLAEIRTWCREIFPDAVVIMGAEPEFSVSRGLAWSGRIDAELRLFREEIEELKNSATIDAIVENHIDGLYRSAVDAMVEPILQNAAAPVFERWRSGGIESLSDTDGELEKEIASYLESDEARAILKQTISKWLKPVADEIEEYTIPICVRHHVPYTALSLNSYLNVSDVNIGLDARNMFAVEEITLMIDSIISILVGLICGGSGIAMISSGPEGIIAGAAVSLLVLILGKKRMQKALMDARIPKTVRKLVPKNGFTSRIGSISEDVRESFFRNLEEKKNEEITSRMADEIASQIEACLVRMAEVVEIPLG